MPGSSYALPRLPYQALSGGASAISKSVIGLVFRIVPVRKALFGCRQKKNILLNRSKVCHERLNHYRLFSHSVLGGIMAQNFQ